MRHTNKLYFFLILFFFSCKNTQDKSFKANSGDTQTAAISDTSLQSVHQTTIKNQENIDASFEIFIEHFNKDSTFQISRIAFPLKLIEPDWEKEGELVERRVQRSEFRKLDFSYDKSMPTREFDKYEQRVKVKKDKAVIEIRGIDNGIMSDSFFEKRNGKWTLVSIIDKST
jgi:hypothetical protein